MKCTMCHALAMRKFFSKVGGRMPFALARRRRQRRNAHGNRIGMARIDWQRARSSQLTRSSVRRTSPYKLTPSEPSLFMNVGGRNCCSPQPRRRNSPVDNERQATVQYLSCNAERHDLGSRECQDSKTANSFRSTSVMQASLGSLCQSKRLESTSQSVAGFPPRTVFPSLEIAQGGSALAP